MNGIGKFSSQFRSALVCFAAILLLASQQAFAQTNPPPWRFMVFGDSVDPFGGPLINTNMLQELGRAAVREQCSFVLFAGDLASVAQPDSPPAWSNAMAAAFEAGIPVYAAIGNHDLPEIPGFLRTFGDASPDNGPAGEIDLTYALDYQNARILVLDEFVATNQYRVNQAWVDAVLSTNALPHVFAVGHVPAFKVYHPDYLGSYASERNAFWHSFTQGGGRLYFCGHDHMFDHSRIDDGDANPDNDAHQFIVGTGGSPLYPDGPYDGFNWPWQPVRLSHEQALGYLMVEVAGPNVTTRFKRRTGMDAFEPADETFTYTAAPRLSHSFSAGKLILRWEGQARLQASSDPAGPYTNVVNANSPFTQSILSEGRTFFRLVR